jgi:hypothetical protein
MLARLEGGPDRWEDRVLLETTARLTIPNVGGTGVTFDAIESLCRQWATELGRHGVRVVWLRTTGTPKRCRTPVGWFRTAERRAG